MRFLYDVIDLAEALVEFIHTRPEFKSLAVERLGLDHNECAQISAANVLLGHVMDQPRNLRGDSQCQTPAGAPEPMTLDGAVYP